MELIIIYIFMGIGLSMDAFSIALVYGTNDISKVKSLWTSILVGILHFIMPVLGYTIFKNILQNLNINTDLLIGIIFLLLSIEMISSLKDDKKKITTTPIALIIFAITVSLDSFSVGIALLLEQSKIIVAGLIFSVISFIFTITGMKIGKYLNELIGIKAKIIGIAITVIFSVKYLLF